MEMVDSASSSCRPVSLTKTSSRLACRVVRLARRNRCRSSCSSTAGMTTCGWTTDSLYQPSSYDAARDGGQVSPLVGAGQLGVGTFHGELDDVFPSQAGDQLSR